MEAVVWLVSRDHPRICPEISRNTTINLGQGSRYHTGHWNRVLPKHKQLALIQLTAYLRNRLDKLTCNYLTDDKIATTEFLEVF
jgi:hypothetical protein